MVHVHAKTSYYGTGDFLEDAMSCLCAAVNLTRSSVHASTIIATMIRVSIYPM